MISRWKHILTRSSTNRASALNFSRSFNSRSRHSVGPGFSQNEMDTITLDGGAFTGTVGDKGVETTVSSGGSTLADKEEHIDDIGGSASLISHVARMGRRPSAPNANEDPDPQHFTVTKEIYIKEELTPVRVKFDASPV